MRFAASLMLLALAACQKAGPAAPPVASMSPATPAATASPIASPTPVLGWTTDGGDLLLLGRQAPAFSGVIERGGAANLDKLRGRWTILGFGDQVSVDAQETTFIAALNAAADQDPDLDLLIIFEPTATVSTPRGPNAPLVRDGDRSIAAAFGVTDLPTYLLIGPDLTIEAVRGALAKTPDNGIKDVIRGVAEIKKQIADPT